MNEKLYYQRKCISTKLSNVRSPADGEEQCSEEYTDRSCNIMSQNEMPFVKDCSASPTPADDCTPAYYRWAQNLHNLLNDHEGINLFKRYLKQECHDCNSLDFWLSVRGFRDQKSVDSIRITNAIHNRFVVGSPDISLETKNRITEKISCKNVDHAIFDKAQKEVEIAITRTTYPNFLKSYLYIQHIQQMQRSASENESNVCSEVEASKNSVTKFADSTSNVFKQSRDGLDVLQTVFEDSELELSSANKLSTTKKTVYHWNKTSDSLGKLKPESQAGHYLKPSNLGYNPYHAKYAAYHPPSAQDSEFQSSTSDAQTDDTMSIVSGSTDCDSSRLCNRSLPLKTYEKHHRKLKLSAPFNQDVLPLYSNFIPRTERLPDVAKQSPQEFATLLTEKLNRVIADQKLEERLNEKLQDKDEQKFDEGSSFIKSDPSIKSKTDPALFNFGAKPSQPVDTAQSILDDHVSRVFHDSAHQTPSPSPGYLTPSTSQLPQEVPAKQQETPTAAVRQPQPNSNAYMYQYNTKMSDVGHNRRDADNFSLDSGADIGSDYDAMRTAALLEAQRSLHNHHSVEPSLFMHSRSKESSRRSGGRKQPSLDCASSCFDSGISGVDVASCSTDSRQKVTTWLEMKYSSHGSDSEREPFSSSPIPGQTRRPNMYSGCRSGQYDGGSGQWSLSGPQNITSTIEAYYCRGTYDGQSMHGSGQGMPMYSLTDSESQMMETKRRLESVKAKLKPLSTQREKTFYDASRSKGMSHAAYDSSEDNTMHKRNTRKSGAMEPPSQIQVAYKFGRGSVPFLCKLPGKCVTLKQFKSLVSKKGNLKYFFKTFSQEFGVVFEEVVDDCDVLPLWEGKIYCQIEQIE